MELKRSVIKCLVIGAMRCNGTHNIILDLIDGTDLELFGVTPSQLDQIDAWFRVNVQESTLIIDDRMIIMNEELWLSQNGIRKAG